MTSPGLTCLSQQEGWPPRNWLSVLQKASSEATPCDLSPSPGKTCGRGGTVAGSLVPVPGTTPCFAGIALFSRSLTLELNAHAMGVTPLNGSVQRALTNTVV